MKKIINSLLIMAVWVCVITAGDMFCVYAEDYVPVEGAYSYSSGTCVFADPDNSGAGRYGRKSVTAYVQPSNATNKRISWESSDISIAYPGETDESSCEVIALKPGEVVFTATTEDGGFTVPVKIYVYPKAETVIAPETITIGEGQTVTVKPSVLPEESDDKATGSDYDKDLIKIEWGGFNGEYIITGLKKGTTEILWTADSNDAATAYSTVNVVDAVLVSKITLNHEKYEIKRNETLQLEAFIKPENATDKSIEWESSDRNVAKVDENGLVTGGNPGTTTIYARSADGSNITASCEITCHMHEFTYVNKVLAGCESAGTDDYWKCNLCGDVFSFDDERRKIPAPTVLSPKGHLWSPWEKAEGETADCTTGVKEVRFCLYDPEHKQYRDGAAKGHTWHDEPAADVPAGCTSKGSESIHCKVCGAIKPDTVKEISEIGHSYGSWETVKESTADAEGIKERVCSRCGDTQQETIPKNEAIMPPAQDGSSDADNPGGRADTDPADNSDKPAVDPATRTGSDGTALGKGASAEAAEAAIAGMTSDNDLPGAVFHKLQLRSSKQANTSITLSWKKVSGAKKYVIYGNKCGKKNKLKKLTTVKNKGTKSYSKKLSKVLGNKVRKGTYYKFMVIAFDNNNRVVSSSKIIHVATKGGKVGNIGKITTKAKNNKVSLKKGKTFKLKGKQVAASKKLKVKTHRKLSYESSNTKVATVSKSGVIKGKKKGSCYVYVYAQNGVFSKIKVTIK